MDTTLLLLILTACCPLFRLGDCFMFLRGTCDLDLGPECTCYAGVRDVLVFCHNLTSWPDFRSLGDVTIDLVNITGSSASVPGNAFGDVRMRRLVLTGNLQASLDENFLDRTQQASVEYLELGLPQSYSQLPASVKQLSNIKTLKLNTVRKSYSEGYFAGMTSIEELYLGPVQQIGQNVLSYLPALRLLQIEPLLNDWTISSFFKESNLEELRKLETLVLNHGKFILYSTYDAYHDNFLSYLETVQVLEMADCDLSTLFDLDPALNDDLNVKVLDLSRNSIGFEAPNRFFSHLPLLRHLDLSYNHISKIENVTFTRNRRLVHLDLSHNYIHSIERRGLSWLPALTYLDLRDNRLPELARDTLSPYIKTLYLGGNWWPCGCGIWWLIELAADQRQGAPGPLSLYELANDLRCGTDMGSGGQLLYRVHDRLLGECGDGFE